MGDNYRVPAFIIIQSVTIVLIWSTSCLLCMSSYMLSIMCVTEQSKYMST